MKYGNQFYIQLSREIFTEKYAGLSVNAKWLYVVLNELEHRYTGENRDFFTRSNAQLSKDSGLSLSTLKRAKSELIKTNLIQTWKSHFIDPDTNKMSTLYYSAYRIL